MKNLSIISHDIALYRDAPSGHPECPERYIAIKNKIEGDYQNWRRVQAPLATRQQLLGAHTKSFLDYIDEISNKYNERNFMSRTKSSATLNIAGVEQFDWWATIHPFTKKPVVGVVLVWRPSSALALEKSAENEEYDDLAF